jgi:hypothetical protein
MVQILHEIPISKITRTKWIRGGTQKVEQVPVADACNPGYSGGKWFMRPCLEKPYHKKVGWWSGSR